MLSVTIAAQIVSSMAMSSLCELVESFDMILAVLDSFLAIWCGEIYQGHLCSTTPNGCQPVSRAV